MPTDIKDHIEIIKNKLSEMKPCLLSQNACVSLSKDAIIAVNEYLQILNLELK